MEITFKSKNPRQIEAVEAWLDKKSERILYGGAKGGGKSFLGCSLIFGDALLYPGTHYYIARKELNDLRKWTIPSIHEVFEKWGLKIDLYATFNGQDNIFHLHNGSKVFLIACKLEPSDPMFERFGSMQMTRGWIEEAGEVEEAAVANLWLATGRWKNDVYGLKKKQLITANPKKGWLKRMFVDPFKNKILAPALKFIRALATDNPYNSPDYLETLSSEKDPIRRARLWDGDWDYDEDKDSLVDSDALFDAFTNTIDSDGKKYMSGDIARKGKDSSAIGTWNGLELTTIEKYEKQDTANTTLKVKVRLAENRIPYSQAIFDEDGIGGAVVDNLSGVKGFIANSSPLPTKSEIKMRLHKVKSDLIPKRNFKNLKAQCGFKLAELINEHRIKFSVPVAYKEEIIEDLTAILRQKDPDSDGKLELRSKDDVKREIGRSPDVGDMILMRAWFELRREIAAEDEPQRSQASEEQSITFRRNSRTVSQNSSE